MRFRDYIKHIELFNEDAPPSSSSSGALSSSGPGGLPPGLGSGPGMPPGLGGAGSPPPIMPSSGGMPPPMGGPGMPGTPSPSGGNPAPMKVKSFDVWDVLERILHNKPIKDDRKPEKSPAQPPASAPSPDMMMPPGGPSNDPTTGMGQSPAPIQGM